MMDIIEFARDVLGLELSEFQEEMLRQVEMGDKLMVRAGREKKTMIARIWDAYLKRNQNIEEAS